MKIHSTDYTAYVMFHDGACQGELLKMRIGASMAGPIKMMAKVDEIIHYADDVYQVTFTPEKKLPLFKAGQFLSLALDDYDPCGGRWPESRAFSLACSSKKNKIVIVYSVRGAFTQRMKEELVVGKTVWISLPLGFCVVNVHEVDQAVVLIAAGTGIAPYIPYLEEELAQPSGRKILLAYGIRGEHCYLFKKLLQDCCEQLPNFELLLFSGRNVDFDAVMQKAEVMEKPLFFISGPPAMIQALQDFLHIHGIGQEKIHVDSWGS